MQSELPIKRNGSFIWKVVSLTSWVGTKDLYPLSLWSRRESWKKKKKTNATISNLILFPFAEKVIFFLPEDDFSFLITSEQTALFNPGCRDVKYWQFWMALWVFDTENLLLLKITQKAFFNDFRF